MNSFENLGVKKEIAKGLSELGIVKPTPIQSQVIPLLLEKCKHLIGQAQTGTGKTAAYGVPILQSIEPEQKVVQALILCPTRELGQQIAKQLFKFTKYTEKIFAEAVYGGEKIDLQISRLSRPTHVVVATPGRLIDLVNKKAVNLKNVNTVVLDEADEMLSMGFKKELDQILGYVSSAQYKWLFSATMPHDIKQIIKNHLSPDAHKIEVSKKQLVNRDIKHQYFVTEKKDKFYTTLQLLRTSNERGMVFCRTKAMARTLTEDLQGEGVKVEAIHGDLLQKERDKVMRAFKGKRIQVLVATDIAARGLDVRGLSFVLHYQLPDKDDYYTHRSGRVGRAGEQGVSLCLVASNEMEHLRKLERKLSIHFKPLK